MKYIQLADPEWLELNYVTEKKSTTEIAAEIGCSIRAVGAALERNGIKARDACASRALQCRESYKYPQLNDKEFLKSLYVEQQLSTDDIAKMVGTPSGNSVRQALIRHGLEVRNRSSGQTRNRESEIIASRSTLDGTIMGDAGLRVSNKDSEICVPHFYKKNKHYDHVAWLAAKMFKTDPKRKITPSGNWLNGKYFPYFILRSKVDSNLTEYYERWYPKSNNYVKQIPEDIQPDSELLLQLFLDDGCAVQRRKSSRTKQVACVISTECFSRDNQEMFCEKVNSGFALGMKTTRANSGTGYRILLPQTKTFEFYSIIGLCPFDSLSYKWK